MAWARESGSGGRGSGGGSGSGPGIGGVGCGVGSGGGNGLGSGGMPAVCPCGDSRKRPLMRRSARCRLKVGAAGGQPWSTERIVASSCGASCSSFQSRSTARRTSSATRPKTRLLDEHGPVVVSRRAHASNLIRRPYRRDGPRRIRWVGREGRRSPRGVARFSPPPRVAHSGARPASVTRRSAAAPFGRSFTRGAG